MFSSVLLAVSSVLSLSQLPSEPELAALLWHAAPELQPVRARVALALADSHRAALLPNPNLDFSANTLPVGPTNPANLSDPLDHVPNYSVGVSEFVEVGKRGPRKEAYLHAFHAAQLSAQTALLQQLLELKIDIAEIAAAELRLRVYEQLAGDAVRLADNQRLRADKGDVAGLDAERTMLEAEKVQSSLLAEQERLQDALRKCALDAGVPCESFADPTQASSYLAWTAQPIDSGPRPELRLLQALVDSAEAQERLAMRRGIPDPTVRLGYVRDQFVVSGNQQNSIFVGASIPVPIFDHGQVDRAAARAQADAARRTIASLMATTPQARARLAQQLTLLSERRYKLRSQLLPVAEKVVQRLEAAVLRGVSPLGDLLLARRSLGELRIDAVEVDLLAYQRTAALWRLAEPGFPIPAELVVGEHR